MDDTQLPFQHFTRDGCRYISQWKMGSGECDPHTAPDKHHDRIPPCQLGQIFRVSRKSDSGIIDDALMHRSGHHCSEFLPTASDRSPLQGSKHVAGIGWRSFSGDGGFSQWDVQHVKAARLSGSRQGWVVRDMQGKPQQPRAFPKKIAVGDDGQIEGQRPLSDLYAQVGADSGRLASGKDEFDPIR